MLLQQHSDSQKGKAGAKSNAITILLQQLPALLLPIFLCACSPNAQQITEDTASAPPNILLAIADDVTFQHMSAYGCKWIQTPAFDRVAKQGLLFQNFYTPNAKCAPSRASLLTGRNSWQLEEAANHFPFFPARFTTFMEALAESGRYYTGHTAKGFAPGNPGQRNGQKRQLTGPAWNTHKCTPLTPHISNIDYAANFEAFLQAKPDSIPFCFWFGSNEPHRAYAFGSGQRIGGKNISDIDEVFSYWPDTDSVRHDMLDYALELEHFDQHLSKMLQLLDEKDQLKNTLIIVTADNGMPFPRVKGQAYHHSNHLPLSIMWGEQILHPGREISDFVSMIDLTATILDLAGLSPSDAAMQPLTGKSLRELFDSPKEGRINPERDHVLIGKERHDIGRPDDLGYPIRGIVTDSFLYLRNFKPNRWPTGNPETGYLNCDAGATKSVILNDRRRKNQSTYWDLNFGQRPSEELYQLSTDTDCRYNLAGDTTFAEIKDSLGRKLETALRAQQDPRILGKGDIFDQYVYSNEKHRDFYNRYLKGEVKKDSVPWVSPTDFEPITPLKK